MTRIISTLFLILTYVGSSGQVKFIDIYNAHKFPCSNKIHSTEEETICSDIKLKFADSLLNLLYNKIMKEIDTEIENSQNELLSLKSMQGQIPRNVDEIENLNREINQALFLKNSLTDSQRRWIKLRDSNELINSIIHQGGTGMVTSEIESKLYDTLERIKKLETLF